MADLVKELRKQGSDPTISKKRRDRYNAAADRIDELEKSEMELARDRDTAEAAADLMASFVLNEPIEWTFHDDAWRRAVLTLREEKLSAEKDCGP